MKKHVKTVAVMLLILTGPSGYSYFYYSDQPPSGHTGADGVNCTNCHSGNSVNASGGSIAISGLPSGNYTPGTTYNFSIAINHGTADRKKWGFEITARNSANASAGIFSSTNPNADLIAGTNELAHNMAVATGSQQSYTYTNLKWTAPTAPTANDNNITFYVAANAANFNFGTSGDFIYTTTLSATLAQIYTFTGNGNWNNAANWSNQSIPPAVLPAGAEIVIDHAIGGECVLNISQQIAADSKFTVKPGKRFRILGSLIINN